MNRKYSLVIAGFMSTLLSIPVMADATQRRSIVDFCELYSYRASKYEDTSDGAMFDLRPMSGSWSTVITPDMFYVTTSCGSGSVSADDLTICDMTMTLVDLCDTDTQNKRTNAVFVLGFSALEFDALDESMLSLNSMAKGGTSNATEESFRIFNDEIIPKLTDGSFSEVKNNGTEVLIYSGNYDYYLSYYPFSSDGVDHEYLEVTAKERK